MNDSDDIVYANIFELERGEKRIEKPEIMIEGGKIAMRFDYGGEAREHVFTVGESE